jgi:uncharacterized protein YijF (DUF1287 family)
VREERLNFELWIFWRFRRTMRSWLLSRARAEGDHRRVFYLRRMLADSERVRSAVKAVGEFCFEAVSWQLLHVSMLDAEFHDEWHYVE